MSLVNKALADENVVEAVAGNQGFFGKFSEMLGPLAPMTPMIAIFTVFYFLLIRPQAKKQKETQNMIDALKKGDKVVTVGGVIGKICKLTNDTATLETSPDTKIEILRSSIAQKYTKDVDTKKAK